MTNIFSSPVVDLLELNNIFIELTAKNCNQKCKHCYIDFQISRIVKDFIDIYFLLKYFTLSQIISFYGAKYKLRNEMHALKSLAYFNDVDLNDWPLLVLEQELTFSKIKKSISTHLKNYSNTELLH